MMAEMSPSDSCVDELIQKIGQPRKQRNFAAWNLAAVAACICVIVIGGLVFTFGGFGNSTNDSNFTRMWGDYDDVYENDITLRLSLSSSRQRPQFDHASWQWAFDPRSYHDTGLNTCSSLIGRKIDANFYEIIGIPPEIAKAIFMNDNIYRAFVNSEYSSEELTNLEFLKDFEIVVDKVTRYTNGGLEFVSALYKEYLIPADKNDELISINDYFAVQSLINGIDFSNPTICFDMASNFERVYIDFIIGDSGVPATILVALGSTRVYVYIDNPVSFSSKPWVYYPVDILAVQSFFIYLGITSFTRPPIFNPSQPNDSDEEPKFTTVPDFTGLTFEDAERYAFNNRLRLYAAEDWKHGRIASQEIPKGRQAEEWTEMWVIVETEDEETRKIIIAAKEFLEDLNSHERLIDIFENHRGTELHYVRSYNLNNISYIEVSDFCTAFSGDCRRCAETIEGVEYVYVTVGVSRINFSGGGMTDRGIYMRFIRQEDGSYVNDSWHIL
jgi:hypothetical protein